MRSLACRVLPLGLACSPFLLVTGCQSKPNPLYAHMAIVYSDVNSETDDLPGYTEDETTAAWSAGMGSRIHDNASVEVAFTDLGDYDWTDTGATDFGSYSVRGLLLTGRLHYPIYGEVEATARVGGFAWQQRSSDNGQPDESDSGLAPVWGFGLQTPLADRLDLRIEYYRLENVDDYPFDQYSLGLAWTF